LVVDMDGGDATPKLLIYQSADGPTTIELRLPERELESADQILWGIDSFLFGRVKGSELVVTDQLTLQRITERQFVNEELLPLMRKGTDLRVEIAYSSCVCGRRAAAAACRPSRRGHIRNRPRGVCRRRTVKLPEGRTYT